MFSFLRKNKRQTDSDQGSYHLHAEDEPVRRRGKGKAIKQFDHEVNQRTDPVLPEKKRARRRLVGAIALVLAAIIILPMLLDPEPQSLTNEIAIQIPSRDRPVANTSTGTIASVPMPIDHGNGLDQQEEIVAPATAAVAAMTAESSKPITMAPAEQLVSSTTGLSTSTSSAASAKPRIEVKPKSPPKLEPKTETKPAVVMEKRDDGARAMAILEGRTNSGSDHASANKFIVQVAALASSEKVDELQGKLKDAGIKSYTQKIATQSGDRIRIRIGPFPNKEEAEQARIKLVKLGLSGSLVPL